MIWCYTKTLVNLWSLVWLPHVMQVLHPATGNSWVLLPDVEADQGPQVSRLGLGDGSGSGQTLQVRGRILGHQECLSGNNHFLFLKFTNYFFLHTLPLFKIFQFVSLLIIGVLYWTWYQYLVWKTCLLS